MNVLIYHAVGHLRNNFQYYKRTRRKYLILREMKVTGIDLSIKVPCSIQTICKLKTTHRVWTRREENKAPDVRVKKMRGNLGIIIDKVQRVEPPDATPRQLPTQLVPSKKKVRDARSRVRTSGARSGRLEMELGVAWIQYAGRRVCVLGDRTTVTRAAGHWERFEE